MNEGHLGADSQWSTYESNVQAYRGLSMSAQSLFLAVGAILLGFGMKIPFFTVLAMAIISTWYVFFPVIFARTAIADYHKFNMERRFARNGERASDPAEPLREKDYANVLHGRALRRKVYAGMQLPGQPPFHTLRETRRKLDLIMPGLVTLVWIIFALYILLSG
ncbi:MAG: hypothetical protein JSS74_17285 [Actinobacteria bacterium]|nr:hypothetical protein [Actinomycetota bacterium]